MPRTLGSLILIVLGAGVLAVAWQGYVAGVLPAGSAGWRAYRPNRQDNPLAFHFFLALYLCGGMALVVWGILALFGAAPALKLN
jgi:amino acid transporter